jgi:hypothetical protein
MVSDFDRDVAYRERYLLRGATYVGLGGETARGVADDPSGTGLESFGSIGITSASIAA